MKYLVLTQRFTIRVQIGSVVPTVIEIPLSLDIFNHFGGHQISILLNKSTANQTSLGNNGLKSCRVKCYFCNKSTKGRLKKKDLSRLKNFLGPGAGQLKVGTP